jgi:glutamate-1-semialdehyde 2,1-aminomutase
MAISHEKSNRLQRRAFKSMPLGVNSNFRYWGDDITPYVEKAKGAYLWDVDGNRFIDYRLAFGPIILGHAYDDVDAVVVEEIKKGLLTAMTYELEIALMEKLIEMCPAVEMARLACSGTEATMHAIRVARAFTGREVVIKFEGNYHGFHDYTLWSTYSPSVTYGNERSPISIPSSSGIPRSIKDLIITLPFNDPEGLERVLKSRGYQVAAIITEPYQGNCGCIEAHPGFMQFIRQKCDEYGIVFILDEVKTGFRIANGGAQQYFNIKPDLATYAKSMGNGYPIAAFGGKKEIMGIIGHGVSQGGTYTNNKPGVAGAFATLSILKEQPILKTIAERGERLMNGLKTIFEDAGIKVVFSGLPAMFSFAFGVDTVTNQRNWSKADEGYYLKLAEAAMDRGVMPDYDSREPWFLCYSHSEADIDETLNIYSDVVKAVKP